jgi:hypothetical protein
MRRIHFHPYRFDPTREIQLGHASWDNETPATKFAWPTATGAWARGGEHPPTQVPD